MRSITRTNVLSQIDKKQASLAAEKPLQNIIQRSPSKLSNHALSRLFRLARQPHPGPTTNGTLRVAQPTDASEREADRVADAVSGSISDQTVEVSRMKGTANSAEL